ncbi:MAG: asparagine synthase (glutamine-hydrolyzing) [Phycisphaerae bacterium]|nr:asparagine synthase (glutamine-hydrolyzing) [Phycisphaerae bacterium]
MCGIFGIVTLRSGGLSEPDEMACRLRDLMAHRGPDGAGLWRDGSALLAHRRLAVLDPSDAGAQPMSSADGRWVVVYSGELYNDASLRRELARRGALFRTSCDTETLVEALSAWGESAVDRLRGMYAFGAYDRAEHRLLLARDPLGIKPLYWWRGSSAGAPVVIFASEVRPIVEHPAVERRPDLAVVGSYLTTIRTTLGERTLFEGVRTLTPGQRLVVDLSGDRLAVRASDWWAGRAAWAAPPDAAEAVARAVEDSVSIHLRSDVPLCALLSGGLDSTIIAREAMGRAGSLRTFCAGTPGGVGEDLVHAEVAAMALGTRHASVVVDRESFHAGWGGLVERYGLPLSTPNEVAIHAVAGAIREAGCVVTLSGEGADELFAGYEGPVRAAIEFEAREKGEERGWAERAARFQVESNAWVPPALKERVLNPVAAAAAEGDSLLFEHYRAEFEALSGGRENRVQAHLAFHRRVNLAGLLLRLDQATMAASVEGRTPLADQDLCLLAESLPLGEKFRAAGEGFETKSALRRAFASRLSPAVVTRPKASFPLPFQGWLGDAAGAIAQSGWARDLFTPGLLGAIQSDAGRVWQLAWPVLNLARWGRRWWG